MKKLLIIALGLAEIAIFSFILQGILISLIAQNITMITSASIVMFLLWLGQKLNNMSKVTGARADGEE